MTKRNLKAMVMVLLTNIKVYGSHRREIHVNVGGASPCVLEHAEISGRTLA